MTGRRESEFSRLAWSVLFAVIVVTAMHSCPAPVYAEPVTNAHIVNGATCTTAKGSSFELPPGWFLDEAKHTALDTETKRLQDAETRLTAENASFRAQAPTWTPGWKSITLALLGGAAAILTIQHL